MKQSLWRIAQYAATIIVWTVVGAGFFALSDYVQQHTAEKWYDRDSARERVEIDTAERMKRRGTLGGALGALGSCIYVARRVIKERGPMTNRPT